MAGKLKTIKSFLVWRGKKYDLLYKDSDSFENLPKNRCTQAYGVCFCGDKIVVGKNKKGHWSLIGGTIERNESFEKTLEREIKEESNMRLIIAVPIGYQKVIPTKGDIHYQLRFYAEVEPYEEFEKDPAGTVIGIKLISLKDYKKYFDWGEIGERIMERAVEIRNSRQ